MMNEVVEFISGTYPWKMVRPYIVVVGERAGTPQTSSEKVITQKRFWKNNASCSYNSTFSILTISSTTASE